MVSDIIKNCANQVNAAMAYRNGEWWDVVTFAVAEAARLRLKVGMHNCPGFSVTGGPWIDSAHAMQKVMWTNRTVSVEQKPFRGAGGGWLPSIR